MLNLKYKKNTVLYSFLVISMAWRFYGAYHGNNSQLETFLGIISSASISFFCLVYSCLIHTTGIVYKAGLVIILIYSALWLAIHVCDISQANQLVWWLGLITDIINTTGAIYLLNKGH